MTKYTKELRQELHEFILESTMVKRIFAMGVAGAAKAKPGILLARAMGFNGQGKFSVNGERQEGSNNKWQRYFAKGCPELIEYLTRVEILLGQATRNPDDYFDSPIPRNKAGEVQMTLAQVQTEEPSEELRDWVAQLPDWGELYTPKGLNFFAVFSLYNVETGANPNYKQLLRACDSYESPYNIRLCQGQPKNDPVAELHYGNDVLRLTGKAIKVLEPALPKNVCGDYLKELLEEKALREWEDLQVLVTTLVNEVKGIDEKDLELPDNVDELRVLLSELETILSLEKELGI